MTRHYGIVKNINLFPVSAILPHAIGYKGRITVQPGEEKMYSLHPEGFKQSALEGAKIETRKGHDGESILVAVWNV